MSFSFTTLLIVYVLGGLSFIPLLVALFLVYGYFAFPTVVRHPPKASLEREGDNDVFKTDDEKLVRRLANSVDVAAGYFLVTREWVPSGINGRPPERASPAGSTPPPQSSSPSVYQSMYRTLFDRKSSIGSADSNNNQKNRGKRPLNEFFVVLRHGHLMLYDDEQQSEVRHVISLGLYNVSIYGGGDPIPEGELYIRRNAIRLTRKPRSVDAPFDENNGLPFYFFSENCSNKEDFYLALVKHQEKTPGDASIPPRPLRYRQKDVISLVQRLHSSEDQLQMNWVNGLLGRVFLSVYRTPEVEQFIRAKIVKKISRVAKPNFLSDIKVQHIYVGDSAPCITNPRLKEMTADGDFCCEFDISYGGNFRLEIATKATINLGARFKPREVNLLLAVLLKRLDGHCVIRIKPPPSNRLWFSFERMPKMELVIEPIVGARQVAWGPILRIIESRIREVIEESVVLPYYDDIPFTDTFDQRFRGGIWHTLKKTPQPARPAEPEPEKDLAADAEDNAAIEEPTEEPLIALGGHKPHSVSHLPPTPPVTVDDDRPATVAHFPLGDSSDTPTTTSTDTSRTPSVKSKDSSTPSLSTDTTNITAEGQRHNRTSSVENGSASSAMSAIKTKASSPKSPSPISQQRGSSSTAATPEDLDIPSIGLSGGSSHAFGNNYTQPFTPPSRSSTHGSSSTKNPLNLEAIGTATAAVKKWYTTRKNHPTTPTTDQAPPPPPPPSTRHLPPNLIPPPPPSRKPSISSTQPINVPKRRSLPPPLLPGRRISAPPLPPRGGDDSMLVVPVPQEEEEASEGERGESLDSASASWDRGEEDETAWHVDEGIRRRGGGSWEGEL